MKRGKQIWHGARIDAPCLLPTEALDQLIDWRLSDPRFWKPGQTPRKYQTQEPIMPGKQQCQWTIELRAHCDDAERNAVTETIKRLARHADATLKLLPAPMKPEVVCYGDDFFVGHFDISLLPDAIGEAMGEHALGEDEGVSDELLDAARSLQHDKNAASKR